MCDGDAAEGAQSLGGEGDVHPLHEHDYEAILANPATTGNSREHKLHLHQAQLPRNQGHHSSPTLLRTHQQNLQG